MLNRVRGQLFGIPGALVIAIAPPSIQGLSTFGGFQFEVLDQAGGDIANLANVTNQVVAQGNQSGKVAGLFTSFTANDPQLLVTIDRDRARSFGLPIHEITDAMAVLLGSAYVNDFDFNDRAYRVYVQADQAFRAQPSALGQLLRAGRQRTDGAAVGGDPDDRIDGAGGDQPLQSVPLDRDHRRRRCRGSAPARRCR